MARLIILVAVACALLSVPCSGSYSESSSLNSEQSSSSSRELSKSDVEDDNTGGECDDGEESECGENETFSQCPANLCRPQTCSELGYSLNCNESTDANDTCPGKPGCVCVTNYVRDFNGKCIPTNKCPSCGGDPNAVAGCGINCNKQCTDIGEEPKFCILLCRSNACDCKEEFYYEETSQKCVLPKNCPGVCGKNEEYSTCSNAICRAQNCSQVGKPIACPAVSSCDKGCVCKENYVRNATGDCVPEDQCPKSCGANEILDQCPRNCRSDYCPRNEAESLAVCPSPSSCPKPKCKCGFNYRKARNGTCIPTRDCPPFPCHGQNEVYNSCPPLCPTDNCSQATPTGRCPLPGRIGITLQCQPKCRCKPGYWRNKGKCVPYGQCPGVCGKNEEYSTCSNAICRAQNCSQVGKPIACPAVSSCDKGCVCKENYVRNATGDCVPENQCPKTCKANEILVDCPVKCPSDYCPRSEDEIQTCPASASNVCRPSECKCGFNYRRAKNGTCIPTRDCPPFPCHGQNEVYNSCPPLCPTDNCSQATPTGRCPLPGRIGITLLCQPKCRCKPGYWRNKGKCVPYGQCPGVCGKNEVYSNCSNTCPPQTCLSLVAKFKCQQPPPACIGGCICQDGYLRTNSTGTCIPLCQCPEMTNSADCASQDEQD